MMLEILEPLWGYIMCIFMVLVTTAALIYRSGRGSFRQRPKAWPLLGCAIEHLRNYGQFHDWLLSQFHMADKFTIRTPMIGRQVCYYTVDPAVLKHMLKIAFTNYPKGKTFYDRMEILLGDGIFNSDGNLWREQRKTASLQFSLKSLKDFSLEIFKEHACRLAGLLSQTCIAHGTVDAQDLYLRTTLDSIGKIGFGVDIGSLPNQYPLPSNEFATAFDQANEIVTLRFIDPFWKLKRFFQVGSEAHLARHIRTIEKFVYQIIALRRQEVCDMTPEEPKKSDIISRFLNLSGSGHHAPMSDKYFRDVVLNFIIAGRDTTAVTMTWLTYQLCRNRHVSYRLWQELLEFHRKKDPNYSRCNWCTIWTEVEERYGDEFVEENRHDLFKNAMAKRFRQFSELLNYDSLKELSYLHAVVTETLRLFPAVPLDPKEILNDDILPDGTKVKRGETIAYSPWCMARMVPIWGPDAMEFNPDRWIKNGAFVPQSEFKFSTFQAGPRTCLGKDSAYMQLKVTMALVCRFFHFQEAEFTLIEKTYRMMATLFMNNGLRVDVHLWDE